jgi:PIN domain nuclease of toxin-antitoxin system
MNLLDTHILIWWLQERSALSAAQDRILEAVSPGSPVALCDISLWEIAMLSSKGRLRLRVPLALVRILPISAAVASAVSELPPGFYGDPADRLIVATARTHEATLLTADRAIIASGAVPVCG